MNKHNSLYSDPIARDPLERQQDRDEIRAIPTILLILLILILGMVIVALDMIVTRLHGLPPGSPVMNIMTAGPSLPEGVEPVHIALFVLAWGYMMAWLFRVRGRFVDIVMALLVVAALLTF